MSQNHKLLKGGYTRDYNKRGATIGVIKGDTRSLVHLAAASLDRPGPEMFCVSSPFK